MNKIILSGVVARDAQTSFTPSKMQVTKFSLRTTKNYNNKQYHQYHNITCWSALAQRYAELKAGQVINILGEIQNRKWKDKDGIDRYITEIIAYEIENPLTPNIHTQNHAFEEEDAFL